MSVFAALRAQLPLADVFSMYGLHPNRAGFVCCPLHNEKTPSLRLYPDTWHCFGCNAGGDAVKLVQLVDGLTPISAARKLDAAFNLELFPDKPLSPHERAQAEDAARQCTEDKNLVDGYAEWLWYAWRVMVWAKHFIGSEIDRLRPRTMDDEMPDEYAAALQARDRVGYALDILLTGDEREQISFYKGWRRTISEIDRCRAREDFARCA